MRVKMRIASRKSVRTLLLALIWAMTFASPTSAEEAVAAQPASGVFVSPGVVDPRLAPFAEGFAEWVRMRIEAGGGAVQSGAQARRDLDALQARTVASLALQVAAGLHYAQQNKIIHRDIKPSNLFITKEKVVKIMDFGLAKMVEEVRRASTVIGGTPNYMAPEQAVGDPTDHRTDLYALGATLFHLVTGSVPFEDGDVTYHHAHTPAPDPREREVSVPALMAELILKLMEKDPAERCQSAREVAVVLNQILKAV